METKNLEALLTEHISNDRARLDRIEVKIDKLSETVIALARAEEKLTSLEQLSYKLTEAVEDHDDRLDKHEARLNSGGVVLNAINRSFWILVVAVLGSGVGFYIS